MAYGLLMLTPPTFAALTPGDFFDLAEAAIEREHRDMERLAWAVMHLMNATGNFKIPVTLDSLLGPFYTLRVIERTTTQAQTDAPLSR